MEFEIASGRLNNIGDGEIRTLLERVYVDPGYTTEGEAALIFEPSAVRKRGLLFAARDTSSDCLAGMLILVPPDSPARRLARDTDGEIHLLGVLPEYRGHGLGARLVKEAIQRAREQSLSRLVLWTQQSMQTAQTVYESAGFLHIDDMNKNGRDFKVYALSLD